MSAVTLVIFGYLMGSVPFAYLLAKWHRGIDLRRAGSGNVGAANVMRTTTFRIGIGAMVLDVAKGAATVLVAQRLEPAAAGQAAAGVAAVIGHIYPVWLGFRGGKGVATTCGVFAVLAPPATAIAGAFFAATVWWTRYISMGSVVAAVLLGPLAYVTGAPHATIAAAVVVAVMVVDRHRTNLGRIMGGVEPRIR